MISDGRIEISVYLAMQLADFFCITFFISMICIRNVLKLFAWLLVWEFF